MLTKEDEKAYFRQKLRPYITEVMDVIKEQELEYKRAVRRQKLYDAYINGLMPYFK